MKRILLAGESWTSVTTHIKGFDIFTTSRYEEGGDRLIKALKNGGYEVDFCPNHYAGEHFPDTVEKLRGYAQTRYFYRIECFHMVIRRITNVRR